MGIQPGIGLVLGIKNSCRTRPLNHSETYEYILKIKV